MPEASLHINRDSSLLGTRLKRNDTIFHHIWIFTKRRVESSFMKQRFSSSLWSCAILASNGHKAIRYVRLIQIKYPSIHVASWSGMEKNFTLKKSKSHDVLLGGVWDVWPSLSSSRWIILMRHLLKLISMSRCLMILFLHIPYLMNTSFKYEKIFHNLISL